MKKTILVLGVGAISIASLLDYYNQTRNERSLSPEDKQRLLLISCRPFDSWLSLLTLAPIALAVPMMIYFGPDYSQITGLTFVFSFFVGSVVNKIGFMYRRVQALASTGFTETFVRLEKGRMIRNAWLEPTAWAIFLFVLVLPLGP